MIDESMIEITGWDSSARPIELDEPVELEPWSLGPLVPPNPFYLFAYITAAGVLSSAVAELTVPSGP